MILGQQLERILKERRISLSHLARETKIPKATLHGWTTGQRSIDPIQVKKVAQALGISLHHLLFGESDPLERTNGNPPAQTNNPAEAIKSLLKDATFANPNTIPSSPSPNSAGSAHQELNLSLTGIHLQEIFSGDLRVTIHRITPHAPNTSTSAPNTSTGHTPATSPTSKQATGADHKDN